MAAGSAEVAMPSDTTLTPVVQVQIAAEVAMPSDTTLTPLEQVQIAAEVTPLLVTALAEVVKGKVQRDFRPPFF